MAIHDDNTRKACIGYTLAHVETIGNEVIVGDMHGAREVDGMFVVPIGYGRHDEYLAWGAPGGSETDTACQEIVHVKRQMGSMLLCAPHGEKHHFLGLHRLIDLRPGQLVILNLV
jgi:hypothetical protein